ncbi:MAG TPA: asparagine synthase-related protein [Steroidobacteraceae bacterium]|nr:asparagine synthase-related protein [Steroidobacteraceae bacterium]
MYRYLALVWDARDTRSSAGARLISERLLLSGRGWSKAFAAHGLLAFHAGLEEGASETLTLYGRSGAVFGRIFNRGAADTAGALRIDFNRSETIRIVATGGRRLLERFWGRYVALIQDAATGEAWILRDPSGALPCLLVSWQGIHLVCCDLEDCCALGLQSFSVNWNYIRALVAHPGLQLRATGLNEVSEVQPGERVRFSGGSVSRTLEWHPLDIARREPLIDPGRATAELRETTRHCVHAWASCYSGIVHNLSGGLDSSIVLSCLCDTPSRPHLTCLNYHGSGPGEDERRFARLMAGHVGAELIEHALDARAVRLERLEALRRSARPWFYLYELEHGEFETELALQRDAYGLFSGAGGDGVYFQTGAELAAADYLFDHGPGAGLLRVAVDAGRISRRSIWSLLAAAIRARFTRRWNPLTAAGRPERALVNPDLVAATRRDPDLIHPWFAPALTRGVPPGILWHTLTVGAFPAYTSSFFDGPGPERTMPLLSQPLVELCLRIPTYVLIDAGVDRAIARRAFASDLPPEIVHRRNKGHIDRHVRDILDHNLGFVRERLLDGRLVREGLLDRTALETYLTPGQAPPDHQYAEILQQHLCVEMWLAGWLDVRGGPSEPAPPGVTTTFVPEG